MKTIVRICILVLSASIIGMFTSCTSQKLVTNAIGKQIKVTIPPEYVNEKEGIVVVTVGTASPLPGDRAQTGTAIFVNGYFFMFDVGAGVVQKSENLRLPLNQLDGVFLTHYHSDHMMDLPNIVSRSWVMGRTKELHVYGPQGLNKIMQATNDFLSIENQYRVDHHGEEIMDISKAVGIPHEYSIAQKSTKIVFQQDGITITAFDVDHEPIEPAVGYVIEYKGKKVVLSGDTKKNEMVQEMAQNCDLLVHDVMLMSVQQILVKELSKAEMNRNAEIITDIQDYHTSPAEVVELAQNANVKRLVLNHFAPAPDNIVIKRLYKKELKGFDGPIHLADDGDVFIVSLQHNTK